MSQFKADEQQDVIDILTADHQDMLDLITEIQQATTAEQRRDTADTVIAESMRHVVAEEMHVYPAIEQYLPNGAEEVDADIEEFMSLVGELESPLRHHVEDEEQDQFLGLRKHIPAEVRIKLGQKVEKAKSVAPTRPHPNAPHSELFHKTVGAGVGMVDLLRDQLIGRATDQDETANRPDRW